MIALVTGAAGFVGSHLCAALLDGGVEVLAVDAFTDHYSRSRKQQNLIHLRGRTGLSVLEADLAEVPLAPLVPSFAHARVWGCD